jgi:hypothetical protein
MGKKIFSLQSQYWFAVLLFVLAPLSKYPFVALPLFNFTSFRIGLYQILACAFIVCSLPHLIPAMKNIWYVQRRVAYALTLFVVVILSGLVFVTDTRRGVLMGLSMLFLLVLLLSGFSLALRTTNIQLEAVQRYMLIAGLFYGLLSLMQLLSVIVGQDNSLLCSGCTDSVFGFPRINLFAAEPQFFANALIPFFIVALAGVTRRSSRLSIASLLLVTIAVGLTFSRGAFLACAVAGVTLVCLLRRNNLKARLTALSIACIGVFVGLVMLVVSAVILRPSAPYIAHNTLVGMVEQLTMGVVSIPTKQEEVSVEDVQDTQDAIFISQGLVEASSNDRLTAAELAVRAHRYSLRTFIIGVGAGNLGPFVVENIEQSAPANLTVYIFYVLIVAEYGVVGLVCLLYLLVVVVSRLYAIRNAGSAILLAVLVGFIVQYLFFGSFINVLYIWVYIGFALGYQLLSKKRARNV